MTNGSGQLASKDEDFAAYEYLRDPDARRALQNYPINVGANTMRHFTYRYDYWECREQVEAWVLHELKKVARDKWKHEHPVIQAECLPNNDLCDRGKQRSRRRISATLRLAKRLAKAYGRGPRRSDPQVAQNAGTHEDLISRLRHSGIDDGRRDYRF